MNVRVDEFEEEGHPIHSGAYIEVFERDGKPVARMNFFDSDSPRTLEQLTAFYHALGSVLRQMKEEARNALTVRDVASALALVLTKPAPAGAGLLDLDLSDMPSQKMLEGLTSTERRAVANWARTCHYEASDNLVQAGPMPECLRSLLPDDHPFKNWRVEP